MRFYDREQEIKTLHDIRQTAERAAQFTVVTGRRRIGKTMLLLKAYDDQPMLYFFVSRKAETELCADFCTQIEETLGVPMLGTVSKFADIFDYLMRLSHQRSFTLVIDEFRISFVSTKVSSPICSVSGIFRRTGVISTCWSAVPSIR